MTLLDELRTHSQGIGIIVVAPPPGLEPNELFFQLRALDMFNVKDPAGAIKGLKGSNSVGLRLVGSCVRELPYREVDHFLLHPFFEGSEEEFPLRCTFCGASRP